MYSNSASSTLYVEESQSTFNLCQKLLCQQVFAKNMPFQINGLSLREIREDDVEAFHEIASYPGFVYYCFDGTKEKTEQFIQEALNGQRAGKADIRKSYMLAVENVAHEKVIGHVTADILDKYPDYFDLAYFTHPDFQGHGVAKIASMTLLKGMFSFLKMEHFVATAHPSNTPSRKILAWLGFEETGEQAEVESADGHNERGVYKLEKSKFIRKHGSLFSSSVATLHR